MEAVSTGTTTNQDDEIGRAPEKPTVQRHCDHCPAVFRSKALLVRHASQVHQPAKKFQCPHCDAGYNSSKNFALHRAAIHGSKPFKCPRCSITFRRHATLVGHIERHYVSEDHICAVCDSEFQSLDELKVHVYEGHEEGQEKKHVKKKINVVASPDKRAFQCNLCEDKVFAKRSLLERHFLVHTKQKPFVCDVCGKAFNQKSTLKTHSLVHSKLQEFVCLLCGLKFSQKVNLRVHMLRVHPKRTASHAGRLPCPYCPCLFKKLGSLNAHKTKVHAALLAEATKNQEEVSQGKSPRKAVECMENTLAPGIVYRCGSCGMNFNDMVQLRRHMREHTNDVPHHSRRLDHHPPEIVQPVVASRSQDHLQGVNDQRRYPCTICPAAFKKSSHLKQHHKSHYGIKGNRCGICDKTFTTSHTLKVHCNSHSQKSQLHYKCDQCSTSFSLQSSLRRHQKLHLHPDRSYSCPYCNRTFKWFQNCRTHIKTSHSEVVGNFLDPIVNSSESAGGSNSAQPVETIPNVELPEEMLIDLSNLPSNVSIVDISNLTNCIVKIDDQLYELPVQIETNHPLNDGISSNESDFVELPDGEVIIQDGGALKVQQTGENHKLNTSDGSLYQYMNETSGEGFSQEEVPNHEDTAMVPDDGANPTYKQSRPRDSKIPNKTEQDLFTELVEDGKKKYSCKGCRKVFKKPVDLRRHIRTHTGERPFRCEQCSKGFTLKAVLQAHLKTHEAQREMLPCPEKGCSSKFSTKTSLELHRRIHTGYRPFQCGVCTLTFRTSGHMQAHMTSHERLAKRREQTNFELLYQK